MKRGKITISNVFLENPLNPIFKILFSRFVPVIIEDGLTAKIYHGYSEEFDEIEEGEETPCYDAIFTSDLEEDVLKFVRI